MAILSTMLISDTEHCQKSRSGLDASYYGDCATPWGPKTGRNFDNLPYFLNGFEWLGLLALLQRKASLHKQQLCRATTCFLKIRMVKLMTVIAIAIWMRPEGEHGEDWRRESGSGSGSMLRIKLTPRKWPLWRLCDKTG